MKQGIDSILSGFKRRYIAPVILVGSFFLAGAPAYAAGTLNIVPSTGLSNGQSVSISGSGFAANSTGSIVECNSDPSQPNVTVAGNSVPVGCTNPLNTLVTTDAAGSLPSTSFKLKTGTVGPAASGNDSSGASAASDAANYPCPPTAAQIAAGDSCIITFGDAGGDDVSQNITFSGQSSGSTPAPAASSPSSSSSANQPASSTPKSTTPSSSASTKPVSSSLTNTGPGDTIGLFVIVVVLGAITHHFYSLSRRKITS